MTSIFNYNTLAVSLETKTRSIEVELKRDSLDFETLFELETLFGWVSSHIEINSILITGSGEKFSTGINRDELKKMKDDKLQRFLSKMQKLVYSMFFLPQTIIVDLKEGASDIAAELAIGADIRLISQEGSLSFDHIQKGMIPACGGIGFLCALVGTSTAKNWILSGAPIDASTLCSSGFIQECYGQDRLSSRNKYLKLIANQAPISRIQAKRSLLEPVLQKLDQTIDFEKEFAWAGMSTRDWEKALDGTPFTPARELSKKLKSERELDATTS